jgi:hypothetical protein
MIGHCRFDRSDIGLNLLQNLEHKGKIDRLRHPETLPEKD